MGRRLLALLTLVFGCSCGESPAALTPKDDPVDESGFYGDALTKGVPWHTINTGVCTAPKPLVGTLATATLALSAKGRAVPDSFLGMCHEWKVFPYAGTNFQVINPIYVELIRNLSMRGGGPMVMRVGGNSQDDLTGAPRDYSLNAVASLCKQANTRLIYGLKLYKSDLNLIRQQIAAGLKVMPRSCVLAWQLGNEPDLRPGYVPRDYFTRYFGLGRGLGPAFRGNLAGPSFAIMPGAKAINAYLAQDPGLNKFVTLHHYLGNGTVGTWDVPTLLQDKYAKAARIATAGALQAAHAVGKRVRIDEMNTVYNGGGPGMSDTLGGALWNLDTSMELLDGGMDGINFITGGELPYSPIREAVDHKGGYMPVAGPPYYAMAMFMQAVARKVSILPVAVSKSDAVNIKVWAFRYHKNVALRVVVINKDLKAAGNVALKGLPAGSTAGAITMTGDSLTSGAHMTLAGQTWDNTPDGKPTGPYRCESLQVGTNGLMMVPIRPGQAKLLEILAPPP